MNLSPTVEEFGSTSPAWLKSAHATGNAQSGTLNIANFTGFGSIIPSGVPLKRDVDGKLSPVAAETDELVGFLWEEQPNKGTYQVAPYIWHGAVYPGRLPEGSFDVTTLLEHNPAFTYFPEGA